MRSAHRFIGLAALVAATMSCGDVVRTGRSPVYLVMDSLAGIRGAVSPGPPSNSLTSDVITNVTAPPPCTVATPCPTVFGDTGQAVLHIALKNEGLGGTTAASPSAINLVTLDRVHVDYSRADGRNTPGVDVPYGFDGGLTVSIGAAGSTVGFQLVRNVAKEEVPLVDLKTSNQIITTIATVTFYGHDQAGNVMSISGTVTINFGNFGDF